MTQEDKDLLLKDLCGRLSYGVKVLCLRDFNREWYNLKMIDTVENEVYLTTDDKNRYSEIETVRPYLFPISSMTTEQRREYTYIANNYGNIASSQSAGMTIQDWFDKNHIDYRGLIPKGLANDATNLNIY